MAKINVGEADFYVVANAALGAVAHGDKQSATVLDKLARKINAALVNAKHGRRARQMLGGEYRPMTWQEAPSVLDTPYVRRNR